MQRLREASLASPRPDPETVPFRRSIGDDAADIPGYDRPARTVFKLAGPAVE